MITETDKAWLAGFIEARKRSFQLFPDSPGRSRLVVSATPGTTDEELVGYVAFLTGVRVNAWNGESRWNRPACREHCPSPHVHVNGPMSRSNIELSAGRVYIILFNIHPYLVSDYSHVWEVVRQVHITARVIRPMSELGWSIPPLKVGVA